MIHGLRCVDYSMNRRKKWSPVSGGHAGAGILSIPARLLPVLDAVASGLQDPSRCMWLCITTLLINPETQLPAHADGLAGAGPAKQGHAVNTSLYARRQPPCRRRSLFRRPHTRCRSSPSWLSFRGNQDNSCILAGSCCLLSSNVSVLTTSTANSLSAPLYLVDAAIRDSGFRGNDRLYQAIPDSLDL
jgi:hypothetical protein